VPLNAVKRATAQPAANKPGVITMLKRRMTPPFNVGIVNPVSVTGRSVL
jgi:hypothetical protein